jgi:ABC-type glycerol-3-phosphate transport system permease component
MTNDNPTLALLVYRTVGSSTIPNLPAAGAVVLLIPSLIFTFIIKNYINQLWGKVAYSRAMEEWSVISGIEFD